MSHLESSTNVQIIGDTRIFAFEIGDYLEGNPTLRRVDIWAGGIRLCIDDDSVYLPQFIHSLAGELTVPYEIDLFRDCLDGKSPEEMALFVISTKNQESPNFDLFDDRIYQAYCVLDLGPTTDNISAFLFRDGARAYFVYSLWREASLRGEQGHFTVVELDFNLFSSVLEESRKILQRSWVERANAHNRDRPAT